ncbi:MAG: polysaccharide deacetylase family protein [Eubacteriales bacterium]|jgi:probable sporulation protein (polysaccharide deacetylase family)|nr:polysaccharide deacetylase family protein [Eubacteriales bacterium]
MRIFWVVKAKTVVFCLVACFALLLVVYSLNYAAGEVFSRKPKYVVFLGHELDPRAADVHQQVARLTQSLSQQPVAAQYDNVNKAVIPEVNGFEIDVEGSVAAVKGAKKGAVVQPVWQEIEPDMKLRDFALFPVYQGNPLKNQVALVINVSWGNEYLEEMLTILETNAVPASFFLVGRWAKENPELVKKIQELGMDFGNHGYSDPHMQEMSPEAIKEEIIKTSQAVEELTGIKVQWFSPPYGEKAEKIYAAAADLGLHTVLWSLDTIDWTLPGEEVIVGRIVEHLHNGAIILMHPTEQTPGALEAIIAGVRQKNLEFVTVSQLLNPSYWPQKYSALWAGN